ncbi:hypothetical protein BZB76_0357 [Actinomadura pelletieri DSM 43383]|uniref:Uncharacterized protein n=1 Tax=Actinomadura pelletieri DSM 43383 TaxID=1120940 RepID=A0A495QXJ4_9ACTN|nr:hypothetical protein [Actinomadura pelletieri]RKS78919.1 hypothetical protein BZB76_0357 [Actinomadura pelletieri DSM 43383]
MFIRGFRRRTGKPAPELVTLFRSIIDEGRAVHPIASDFLEHFMDGVGASRTLSPRWLRSFKAIRKAERRNQRRFERQLAAEAGRLTDGASTWLRDHWDARVNAFIGTELFYVSRMSLLRSRGSFILTRSGTQVRVSGTVRHHWFDPYDWDRGRWVYIPRHGFVPIAVGRDLVEADEARDFLMESRHVQTVEGACVDGRWPRRRDASFAWSSVRTGDL